MTRGEGRLGGWLRVLPHLLVSMTLIAGCGGARETPTYDAWKDQTTVTGDFDAAEARWRDELAMNPWSVEDMNQDVGLLTDDPPGPPEQYGEVAFSGENLLPGGAASFAESTGDPGADAEALAAAESEEFWSNVGTASFSAFTVLFTVGMAVAPYLLL